MRKAGDFYFYFNQDKLKDLVEKFKTTDKKELKLKIFNYILGSDENLDLKQRKEIAQVKKLEAEAKIKEWEVIHLDTFGKTPSYSADKAIKNKALSEKSLRELTNSEIDLIVKHIALENTFDGWKITCMHCKNQTSYIDRLEGLHDAARHLSAVHGHKVLQK